MPPLPLNLATIRPSPDSRAKCLIFPHVAAWQPPSFDPKTVYAVELCLMDSGMTHTILQPTCSMEVWLSVALGFDVANAKAQIYGSGTNRISWISYHDVASFAALSLEHAEARNATMKLGGPDALRPLEVIQIFERRQGRKYDVQFVSDESLRAQKSATTDPLQQSFAALMLYYARGEVIDMRDILRRFSLRMMSVDDYAATAV